MAREEIGTREEQALAEMAATRITRRTAWALTLAFLALLAAVPIGQELYVRRGAGERTDPRRLLTTSAGWLPAPAELRAFEDDLEDASFLRAALLGPVQALLCRLGAGNEQAYPGRDGWLFYRPDVEHVTGPGFLDPDVLARRRRAGDETTAPPEPDPLVGMRDLRDQLAERGIELLLVPTPLKPMVHPERLAPGVDGAPLDNASGAELDRRLAEAGLARVDLDLGTGDEPRFLRTDTHWTPAAMEHAAARIATRVRELLPPPDGAVYARGELTVSALGDVTRMLQLDEPERLYPAEDAVIRPVHEVRNGDATTGPARVLLLGDSFANIYSLGPMGWGRDAGLAEQLRFELQEPVDALRVNDNGSFATRQALARELRQGNDLLRGKELVVWQFAARELSQGDWRPIELPHVDAPVPPATDAVPRRLTGVVRRVAPVPRPGSVPYKDAITSLHLVDVVAAPPLPGPEVVVFRWGMRDGAWTATTRLRPGDTVDLDVVPWAVASAEFGGFNRAELDDAALWALPTFWAPLAEDDEPAPRATLSELAAETLHAGADGWLYFGPELRHLAAGEFWGPAAREVGRAPKPELRDPLPAILDFHAQLEGAGVELWVVPVPPKAVIHPEPLGVDVAEAATTDRRFLELLAERGVRVVDLVPLLRAARGADGGPLYCKQDTHWSPRACELVARRLAEELADHAFDDVPRRAYERTPREVEIAGDLWRRLERPELPQETLTLNVVAEATPAGPVPVAPWRASPVLLLGDSHVLVFHAGGDLLAKGAGLPEQLAFELGFPVDVVGVRGSGSTAARISLLRRRDELAGKRVVLWVFAARDFTQSTEGWREVPVIRR